MHREQAFWSLTEWEVGRLASARRTGPKIANVDVAVGNDGAADYRFAVVK